MIYTLTVNPSVDYHMDLSRSGFEAGKINRSLGEEMFPGGKGLNVSVVLAQLGIDSTAWGFAAGRCGGLLEARKVHSLFPLLRVSQQRRKASEAPSSRRQDHFSEARYVRRRAQGVSEAS